MCNSIISLKNSVYTLILKYFIAKNVNHHLTMLACHQPSICEKNKEISAKHNETGYACNKSSVTERSIRCSCLSSFPSNFMWSLPTWHFIRQILPTDSQAHRPAPHHASCGLLLSMALSLLTQGRFV